jgi:hypothetical protein
MTYVCPNAGTPCATCATYLRSFRWSGLARRNGCSLKFDTGVVMLGRVTAFGGGVRFVAGGLATSARIAGRRAKRQAAEFFAMFRQAHAAGVTTTTVVEPTAVVTLSAKQLEQRYLVFWDLENRLPGLKGSGLDESAKVELMAIARREESDLSGAGWSPDEQARWGELADTLEESNFDQATNASGRRALNRVFNNVFELKPAEKVDTDDTSSS